MMKNNQLRNNNLLLHKGCIKTVTAICGSGVIFLEDAPEDKYGTWIDLDDIEFISITEEWLERLGFSHFVEGLTIGAWSPGHPSQRFDIDFREGEIFMKSRYQGDNPYYHMRHIKYVHQLQNLYFSLTGEELTYRPV